MFIFSFFLLFAFPKHCFLLAIARFHPENVQWMIHSDDEIAFLSYFNILFNSKADSNRQKKVKFRFSLLTWWKSLLLFSFCAVAVLALESDLSTQTHRKNVKKFVYRQTISTMECSRKRRIFFLHRKGKPKIHFSYAHVSK